MTNEEKERLIKEAGLFYQESLNAASGVGSCLLIAKEHESREAFVEILSRFGLTEIEGEAICKAMKRCMAPENAERIAEVLLKSQIRQGEAAYE